MFYDLYLELCKRNNVSPTRAALEIGVSKSTPTTWKKRGLTPQGETLSKIADYFDVTTDYLLGTDQKESPFAIANEGSAKTQQKLKVLARHLDKIPEEKRERLIRNFEESIDVYLDAMGIPKEGE